MTVLITGAGGFVGTHLANHLLSQGHQVVALVRSVKNSRVLKKYKSDQFRTVIADLSLPIKLDFSVSSIVHLAAQIVYPNITETEFAERNIITMANTIRLAESLEVKKFIFLSSISVYGKPGADTLTEISPFVTPSGYGTSKYLSELMLSDLKKKVSVTNIRIPSIIGKAANPNFITKISESALNSEELIIQNPNTFFNSTIHVNDISSLISELLSKNTDPSFDTFNLACKDPVQLINLVRLIIDKLSSKSKIIINDTPTISSTISIRKLLDEYQYTPMSVSCAIDKFLKEFQNI